VALIETVAGQVAVGVENALLYQETRRKGDEIAAKNRELEAFVYTASHDLRAPLVTIQGFASILLADLGESLSEDARFYLERIRTNTGRMERLIDDLLELSRAGRVVGRFAEVPVGEVVAEALDALQPSLRERGVETVAAEEWPTVPCDRERLLQVFTNLIGNAVKFLGPDHARPRIELGWCDRGDSAEFHVRDNGIGIEAEYHERIFAVFQRLNELDGVDGTGVGLAIVKRIIDVHGGRVWVDSDRGEGATFRFTLPWRREDPA
jgi:signal transduction histidine kinase